MTSTELRVWGLAQKAPLQLLDKLQADGVVYVSDLKAAFVSEEMAEQYAPGAGLLWSKAADFSGSAMHLLAGAQQVEERTFESRRAQILFERRVDAARLKPLKAKRPSFKKKEEQDENSESRIEAEKLVLLGWTFAPGQGLRPKATLDDALKATLQESQVQRLAKFEAASLKSHLNAWQQFVAWCIPRGCTPKAEAVVDEAYVALYLHEFGSRYASLKWLVTHVKVPVEWNAIKAPGSKRKHPAKQAIPLELQMIQPHHEAFHAAQKSNAWQTQSLAMGCLLPHVPMRYKHLERSRLIAHNQVWLAFHAFKGKTGDRAAFVWYAPASPLGDTAVGDWIIKHCLLRQQASPTVVGVVFNHLDGAHVDRTKFQTVMRETMGQVIEEESLPLLLTYSYRRFAPTAADTLRMAWVHRMALAGWREKIGDLQDRNLMPCHYSDRKQASEVEAKLCQNFVLTEAFNSGIKTWPELASWWSKEAELLWPKIQRQATEVMLQVEEPNFEAGHQGKRRAKFRMRPKLVQPKTQLLKDFMWITTVPASAKVHWRSDKPGVPKCELNQRREAKAFKATVVTASSVSEAVAFGKQFCKSCFRIMPPDAKAQLLPQVQAWQDIKRL